MIHSQYLAIGGRFSFGRSTIAFPAHDLLSSRCVSTVEIVFIPVERPYTVVAHVYETAHARCDTGDCEFQR